MGIQRFGTRMRGHAVRSTLGTTASPAQEAAAIIDGPGLAHFIYYRLCHKRDKSAVDITYTNIVAETVAWLDALRSIGYRIEAILFDGALPVSKKDIRIRRLQAYADRVLVYKQSIGSGSPVLRGTSRTNLPPPPFLVFAVVEELLQHAVYGKLTYVVPGEADPYCVAAAQTLSQAKPDIDIVIFSDDADLLVYRMGERSSVVPLRDLDMSESASVVSWTGDRYWPAQIAGKGELQHDDLIEPAFAMARDPHCTFESALRQASSSQQRRTVDFAEFARSFTTNDEMLEWARLTSKSAMKADLASRDSRVSELVCQLSGSAAGEEEGSLRMYLPFLLDDPSRKTAWTIGEEVRLLAYSVLLRDAAQDAGVQEYTRSGARLIAMLWEPLQSDELESQLDRLVKQIEELRMTATSRLHASNVENWQCFAMQLVCQHLHTNGSSLPNLDDVSSVLLGKKQSTWPSIQLSAQYQAAYYSLRMLQQIAQHCLAQKTEDDRVKTDLLDKLNVHLRELPSIMLFFNPPPVELDGSSWRSTIERMLASFPKEEYEPQNKPRKKTKRTHQSGPEAALAENPFALLAED